MEFQNRNLSQIITQTQAQQQEGSTQSITRSYNTFLNIFSIQLVHRFPDVDLSNVDEQTVRNFAEFSLACSQIAQNVWDEVNSTEQQKRQRFTGRQTRSA